MASSSRWGVREAVPASIEETASNRAAAPKSARRTVRDAASSCSPMETAFWRITSPASSAFAIYMMDTPVSVSPFSIAQLMGAAPRYRGSREEWTLIQPNGGIARISSGRIFP